MGKGHYAPQKYKSSDETIVFHPTVQCFPCQKLSARSAITLVLAGITWLQHQIVLSNARFIHGRTTITTTPVSLLLCTELSFMVMLHCKV